MIYKECNIKIVINRIRKPRILNVVLDRDSIEVLVFTLFKSLRKHPLNAHLHPALLQDHSPPPPPTTTMFLTREGHPLENCSTTSPANDESDFKLRFLD